MKPLRAEVHAADGTRLAALGPNASHVRVWLSEHAYIDVELYQRPAHCGPSITSNRAIALEPRASNCVDIGQRPERAS